MKGEKRMKEYKEPVVEVIDLPTEDIITTSGSSTGSPTETEQSHDVLDMLNSPVGSFGPGANGQ